MRIIDLSAPIAPSPPDAAPFERVEIKYTSHAEGAAQVQAMLSVPPHLLRNGEGWAVEEFTRLGTHSVTHVDAPWHYNSQIQGRRAATIDELPLEWFFADGVVLDMTRKADGEKVEVGDVEAALADLGYSLKPLDIVLVRTGRDAFYGQPDYVLAGLCGYARGDPLALRAGRAGHGHRRLGMGRAAGPSGQGGADPAGARASSGPPTSANLPYSQIERLVNLGALPAVGFKVACFPLKIRAACRADPSRGDLAGLIRVVA